LTPRGGGRTFDSVNPFTGKVWAVAPPEVTPVSTLELAPVIEEAGFLAGVWTRDVQRAHQMAAGTVWINNYRKVSYASPFGGYKQSGMGRENGLESMREYTQVKSVWVDAGNTIEDPFRVL
jgi:acyl-CoA reductase-like NAD-dependent aldehyde dehydrogenase